jgi:hypothetical protein
MILSLKASGETEESGLETKSFWSRVQKGTDHPRNDYEAGGFSVNIHKVGPVVPLHLPR